ncbi:hypothetical protein HDU91_003754, partial [Kappamyces sp. JEL0680]
SDDSAEDPFDEDPNLIEAGDASPEVDDMEMYDDEMDEQSSVSNEFHNDLDDQLLIPSRNPNRRIHVTAGITSQDGVGLDWISGRDLQMDPIDINLLGRPLGGHRMPTADLSHPLLVNQNNNSASTNTLNLSRIPIIARGGIIGNFDDVANLRMEIMNQLYGSRQNLDLLPGSARGPFPEPNGSPLSELDRNILQLHGYVLSFTEERWKQEARVLYGSLVVEKSQLVLNAIVNALLPSAYEAKKLEEEEARVAAEKARLEAAAEEEKNRQAKEDNLLEADAEIPKEQQEGRLEDQENADSLASPAAEERVVVMIDGNPVDITGSGIDVTFLEALPDDLRLEVVNQHFREREAREVVAPAPAGLNSEFLDALPFEIREEVIRQERLEAEQRESFALEQRRESRLGTTALTAAGAQEAPFTPAPAGKAKAGGHRESIGLVDSAGIASLLRLVFVPEQVDKSLLFHLLGNLCENTKSRVELLGLLLSVLGSGSPDLAIVDKAFSHLSLKNRMKPVHGSHDSPPTTPSALVPNLVAQRCLEVLTTLTESVSSVGKYFLTESEPSVLFKTPRKKGKGKDKLTSPGLVYPVVLLLNLLDQPVFLQSPAILEQLVHLLSNVLRPLSHIAKKKFLHVETKAPSTETSAALEGDVKMDSSSAKPDTKDKHDIKLPFFPEESIRNVVRVLQDGSSSSKSFQFTLSVIQYLCSYPSHLNVIVGELTLSAQTVLQPLLQEVNKLLQLLKHPDAGDQEKATIVEIFTSPFAYQAKLLRILKTIDYLFSKTNGVALTPLYLGSLECYQNEATDNGPAPTDMEVLAKIYEKLRLNSLWQKLGEAIAIIDTKDDLIHIGTMILPLIEAYMVISKPSVTLLKQSQSANSQALPHVLVKQHSEVPEMDKDGFMTFADVHKRVLNTMVRNNPSLMNGSFSLLVQNPKALEFDNKRTYFNKQLHKERRTQPSIQINVRRQYVFEESYQQLQGRSGDTIKYGKLNVRFRDEEGVDAGGVTREWFSALALQMFNPDYALFRPSAADKVTYQPNRASGINPDHLFYFKFVGRIIGKAIYDGRLLDAHFTRSFYKCMIAAPVDHKDMEAIDPEFYKSLDWILNNDITDVLDLTFSMDIDDFGRQKIIDLKEDGRNIAVTEENKVDYVRLVTEQRLVVAIKDQIHAFLSGFHEIIPKDLIRIFNEQELELLISGLPDIDIDDWKNNTDYQNYSASSPQIQWFWRAVRSFSQEERAKLIQFATGTSKVPLGGFAQLQGSTGNQKFQIHKEFSSTARLPSAHTW